MKQSSWWPLLVLLLAFILRVYGLADVAVNDDESYVYNRWISQSVRSIMIDDMVLNNHSTSHVLDRLSILLLGDTLFSLRWPAVCLSMLGVAFIYKMADHWFGKKVGLSSALLLAISPYAIYFAHTFRGYTGVIVYPIVIYLLAFRSSSWGQWLAFGFVTVIMLYDHVFTGLALVNLMLFVLFFRVNKRGLGLGVTVAGGLLVVLYAPIWSRFFLAPEEPLLWVQRPHVIASLETNLFVFTRLEEGSYGLYGIPFFVGLVGLGAIEGWKSGHRRKIMILLGWALLPFVELWLLQNILTDFWSRPKYVGYTLPPLLILGGVALSSRRQKAAFLLAIPLVLVWYLTIVESYQLYAAGNWLQVGNYLHQEAGPFDLVVCHQYNHPWRDLAVDSDDYCTHTLNYRRKADTSLGAPVFNSQDWVFNRLSTTTSGAINRSGRVWLVVWEVPAEATLPPDSIEFHDFGRSFILPVNQQNTYAENLLDGLLQLRVGLGDSDLLYIYNLLAAPLAAVSGQDEIAQEALAQAAQNRPDHPKAIAKLERITRLVEQLARPPADWPVEARFGGSIWLQGYNIDKKILSAGSQFELSIFWRVTDQVEEDYMIFWHLRDEANRTVAQLDYPPFGGGYPTQHWQPGQQLIDSHHFSVPEGLPPGQYTLLVGFYHPVTGQRLPLWPDQSGEDAAILAPLTIE